MQLFTTHKGGKTLLIGRYKYFTIRKGKDSKEFWKCSDSLCSPKTMMEDDIVKGDHNYVPPNYIFL